VETMLNVDAEVAAMKRLTVGQLREKFIDVFGEDTRCRNKPYLIKRIAWGMQARVYGGLSEAALKRAEELADIAYLRMTPPKGKPAAVREIAVNMDGRLPSAGTVIVRTYKGRRLEIEVLNDQFRFEGQTYKSLSAVAKHITGTHTNGYLFFRLGQYGGEA
jgi:hypothetical protein